jgi:hypothetical protein
MNWVLGREITSSFGGQVSANCYKLLLNWPCWRSGGSWLACFAFFLCIVAGGSVMGGGFCPFALDGQLVMIALLCLVRPAADE